MDSPLSRAIERGLSVFRASTPLTPSEWMDRHFILSTDSVEVRWQCLSYQRAFIDAMGNDDIRIVTIQKSARIGYTSSICGLIGYNIHHRRRGQVIYQPTDDEAKAFCKDSIDPMISSMDVIRSRLIKGDKKGKDNTLNKKSFLGAPLDIRGGKSPRNFRRITKDVAYYDELDGFDHNIGGEGSALVLGDKRLTTSPFPKSIRGSTPGQDATSLIVQSLSSADLVFYRFLPCQSCMGIFRLEWKQLKWENKDSKTAAFVCPHCSEKVEYASYAAMDRGGEWRTLEGHFTDGVVFRDPQGALMPAPRHVGFHIWGAYSYFMTWPDMAHEFLEARGAQKRGDNTLMIGFVNTVLAETWKVPGDRHHWEEIRARAEPYKLMVVPRHAVLLTAGVDCQDDRLPIVVRAWTPDKESWLVYYTELIGDPIQPEVWRKLDLLLYRDWEVDGEESTLKITSMAIDTGGHRTQAVYNYCRSRWSTVMATKGASEPTAPILGTKPRFVEVRLSGNVYKSGVRLWLIGVTRLKDDLAARMQLKEGGPGCMHWPLGLDDEYYMQFCGEIRETSMVKGRQMTQWVQSRAKVDAWDAEILAYLAAIRAGLEIMSKTATRSVLEPVQRDAPIPASPSAPIPRPPRFAPQPSSWLGSRSSLRGWLSR